MKKLLYLLSVVVLSGLLSSSAQALTPIGPPVATLDRGQFAAGFGYAHSKGDWGGVTLGIPWTEKDEWTEIKIALGPSYKDGSLCLYGGPFLHFIDGDREGKIACIKVSGDFEEDSNFGGFVGAQFDLDDNTTLGFEYLQTGSDYGFGARIKFRF